MAALLRREHRVGSTLAVESPNKLSRLGISQARVAEDEREKPVPRVRMRSRPASIPSLRDQTVTASRRHASG